jgi:hypothetical protein
MRSSVQAVKDKKRGFPEWRTFANIARDKQSN